MDSIVRHGRLQRIARFAIFFTGLTTLGMGGVMCLSSFHQSQQEAQLTVNQNLKTQAQVLVDQFHHWVETLKSSQDLTKIPYVSHRGVLKFAQGVPAEIESLEYIQRQTDANAVGISVAQVTDLSFEERLLKAFKKQISVRDLSAGQISMGTFETSEMGSKEGIFVAVPFAPASEGIEKSTDKVLEKVTIVLVDPVKAMSTISKISFTRAEADPHAYLIGADGKVLAHTLNAFVGTDLHQVESLKETLENLFLGAQSGIVTHYQSIEGEREQVAFVRAGVYPFAVGVEQKSLAPVLSAGWIANQMDSGAARKNFGLMLILFAGALVLMSGASMWMGREIHRSLVNNNEDWDAPLPKVAAISTPKLAELPHEQAKRGPEVFFSKEQRQSASPQQSPLSFSIAGTEAGTAAERFAETQAALAKAKNTTQAFAKEVSPAKNEILDFVSRISQSYTLEGIERELVDTSSKITDSPVLFFRYQKRNQNLMIAAAAGAVHIQNHSTMQVYVRKEIENQILKLANDGKVASVTHYNPISRLMMTSLNVAHFEAWAVTSDKAMHVHGAQLMGVLVVLQAGFKSAEARPVLGKMIREAGNYLNALNNRLRLTGKNGNTEAQANASSNSIKTL